MTSTSTTADNVTALLTRIQDNFAGSERLLLFDRDGTLVPIIYEPAMAVVDAGLKTLMTRLSMKPNTRTGVISARGLAQLFADFGREHLILAGNYGLEICYPDGYCEVQPGALKAESEILSLYTTLQKTFAQTPGLIIENHGFSLCLHTDPADEVKYEDVHEVMSRLQRNYNGLKVRQLPTSYEVLPQMVWDKSYALSCIQKHLFGENYDRLYLFAGDSEYDEPGFNWVNRHGGISIRIGSAGVPTAAHFVLDSPHPLHEFIRKLADL